MKRWALLVALCAVISIAQAQQAQLVSAMIHGCETSEGDGEYLIVYSGPSEITNVQATDVNITYRTNFGDTPTGITDSYTSNASYITALNNELGVGANFSFAGVTLGVTDIPAGSHIIIFNDGVTTTRNFDQWDTDNLAGTVYVMFSDDSDWATSGQFENSPTADRYFTSDINGTATSFTYNNTGSSNWPTDQSGNYATWADGGGAATIYSNYTSCNPINFNALPITLISFRALAHETYVALEWITAEEFGNSHFTLYRSADGRSWQELAMIPGSGTTAQVQTYTFRDLSPLAGRSFYRLKQTDFNGDYETFEAVSVVFNPDLIDLKVYPNPTTDFITVKCSEAVASISLIDSQGHTYRLDTLEPTGMLSRFDLHSLPTGLYQLLIHGSETTFREKVIKK